MERLTIEAPHAYAAFSLSSRLDGVGSPPRVDVVDARVVILLEIDETSLETVLRLIQEWLSETATASVRLSMRDREFVLAA